jgi:diguanylate cyclase
MPRTNFAAACRSLMPPAHLGLVQRRAFRLLVISSALGAGASLLWAPLLLGQGMVHEALAYLAFAAASLLCGAATVRGRLRLAVRCALASWLVFLSANALWLSAPVQGMPPSAPQYLLAAAVASLLLTRGDSPGLRYGAPVAFMTAYVLIAASGFSWAEPVPSSERWLVWGAWSDHVLAAVAVVLTLHVLQTDSARLDDLTIELGDAIKHDRLDLHYQPQLDSNGQVLGVEALVRWQHPLRGAISPAEFVPLAERFGLIVALGEWVLHRACRQLAHWARQPQTAGLTVAVNVSAQQFAQPEFVERLLATLAEHGVPAARLKVELTESALLHDPERVIAKMRRLRGHGVQISLDDFGTGFSSLSLLRRLPLDQLKIDQSFVRDMMASAEGAAIVRTIIALGASLKLELIAEGVETEAHREALLAMGCVHFQGYLFARPMQAGEIEPWLRSRSRLSTAAPAARAAEAEPALAAAS